MFKVIICILAGLGAGLGTGFAGIDVDIMNEIGKDLGVTIEMQAMEFDALVPSLASGKLDLRVFVDRGSVEVYVNGGHQVLSSYSYASEGPRAIKLVAESGSLKVDSLKLHHMKSIGLE